MAKFTEGAIIKEALIEKLKQAEVDQIQVVRIEIGQAIMALEMMGYPFPPVEIVESVRDGPQPQRRTASALLSCPLLGYPVVERRNPGSEPLEPILLLANGSRV